MYLSRLTLNHARTAILWVANPYRVHQRLNMACESDTRLLFRIESSEGSPRILVQTHQVPDWPAAFREFPVLALPGESKSFEPHLRSGSVYRFRLLANPTYVKTTEQADGEKHKARLGYFKQDDQINWLKRKLDACGAELLDCIANKQGLQHSHKSPDKQAGNQVHLAVVFEGVLIARDPGKLLNGLESGIGPAKSYGFGLLSLAAASMD